jgi:hypothetical protein
VLLKHFKSEQFSAENRLKTVFIKRSLWPDPPGPQPRPLHRQQPYFEELKASATQLTFPRTICADAKDSILFETSTRTYGGFGGSWLHLTLDWGVLMSKPFWKRGPMPLTAKRDLYVQLMSQGMTNSAACRQVGVNRKTGQRWRLGRVERTGYAERQHAIVYDGTRGLCGAGGEGRG